MSRSDDATPPSRLDVRPAAPARIAARLFLLGALGALLAAPAAGCSGSGPQPAGTDEAVLMEREQDWLRALRERNANVLYRILAPEFRMTRPDSAVTDLNRQRYVGLAMGAFRLDSFRVLESRVEQMDDVALVDLEVDWYGALEGRAWHEVFRWTDVWIHRDGRWMSLLRVGRPAADSTRSGTTAPEGGPTGG